MKNLREQLNLINSMGLDLRTKNNALATRIDKLDDFAKDEKYLQLSIRKYASDTDRRREEKYKCPDVLYEVKKEYEGTLDLLNKLENFGEDNKGPDTRAGSD
jgi:hypothetical protein